MVEGVSQAEIPAQQTGIAQFSVSSTGSLMYVPGTESAAGGARISCWLDRKGNIERLNLPSGSYEFPRVSPDGKQLAFDIDDGKEATSGSTTCPARARYGDSRSEAATVSQCGRLTVSV